MAPGLGSLGVGPQWNDELKPGPREIGFDYSFLLPTTNDRVPQVYVENYRVLNLNPKDPPLGRKESEAPTIHWSDPPPYLKMGWSTGITRPMQWD